MAAPVSAITQATNLPGNMTVDSWVHIWWNPANGKNADPAS
jgi:hypothetical protein